MVEWTGLNISGLTNLTFSGDFAEYFDSPGDIDTDNDSLLIEAQIDGGGFLKVLQFSGADFTSNGQFNGNFREDTDFDGTGDGTTLVNSALAFVKPIAGVGSNLDLRFSVYLDSGDEDFSVDNFVIHGEDGPVTDTPPSVTTTTPSNGATNVAVDTAITIIFNESVDLTASAVTLECPAATTIAFTGLPANDVTSITLTPGANLPESTLCNATVVAAQVTDNDGAVDTMAADVAFSFTTATPSAAGDWVINEIQADPDAALGDANGDGTVNTADDEFVEIVNNSGSSVDISGWTLADGNSVRHAFPANTIVADQCAVVIFGGGTPTGGFGGATAQAASANTLSLNNGGDSVTLNNGATEVVTYSYGSEGDDNQSLTRSPDITGDDLLVKHTSVAAAHFSPGTKIDGTAFAGCTPPVAGLKIHEVQGAGTSVTGPNTLATVEAVVIGDYQADGQLGGFFFQEEDRDVDGNPNTSEGIFVYCGSCPVDVAVGDVVQVTGTQEERYGMSQLDATDAGGSVSVQSSGNALPSAAGISLPLDAVAYEPFEGMLVTFSQELTVAEYFTLARYGQITLHQGGRIEQFTNANAPDASAYAAHLDDKARRTIILDDDNNIQNAPLNFIDSANDKAIYYPSPGGFSTANFFRGGDTIANLTGVLHWSFAGQTGTDAWRVRPVPEQYSYTFTPANPRPTVPNVGGNIQVTSINVLNYFNGDGAGGGFPTSRGADSPVEFARQTEKIVAAINALDADVIGLMEIENDYANGTVSAIADLVDALNADAEAGVYGYVDPGSNVGTDEIAVGFVYKTTVVTPLGSPAILDSAAFVAPNGTGKNRPAIAHTFRVSDSANPGQGELFTVAVNHLKSKGSSCEIDGNNAGDDDPTTGQGNCNDTRTKAAQALTTWLAGDPTGSGDADTLIIGDLNAYAKEDPITAITGAGYTDLLDFYSGGGAYGYVFDGEIGYLDHALANPALAAQVTGAAHWHINADEVNVLDYNDTVEDPGEQNFERKTTVNTLYESNAFRSSDHDPVLVGLDLQPDLGNLPAGYGAARHNGRSDELFLGTGWSIDASDDSVASLPAYSGGSTYSLGVIVHNTGSAAAQLVGWVDFDGNGSFGAGEMSLPALGGTPPAGCVDADATDNTFVTGNIIAGCEATVTLQWDNIVASGSPAQLYARIRLTTDAGTFSEANFFSDASPAPTGLALDGEVEDFGTTPLSVTISYVAATRSGTAVDYAWQTATEVGVAGFNIVVGTESDLAQINEELIVSKVIDSVAPTDYRFAAMTDAETFYIDQIGIDGVQSRHGPFTVGQIYGCQSRPDGAKPEVTIWLSLIQR